MLTGQQEWEVKGDSIFTGRWISPHIGFKQSLYSPYVSPHPLKPEWLLVTACALNASSSYLYQFAIFDSTRGQVIARSSVSPPLPLLGLSQTDSHVNFEAMDPSSLLMELSGTLNGTRWSRWRVYEATTLTLITGGFMEYQTSASHYYVGVTKETVSVYWAHSGQMQGTPVNATLDRGDNEEMESVDRGERD